MFKGRSSHHRDWLGLPSGSSGRSVDIDRLMSPPAGPAGDGWSESAIRQWRDSRLLSGGQAVRALAAEVMRDIRSGTGGLG
jgi:hypothetical protein